MQSKLNYPAKAFANKIEALIKVRCELTANGKLKPVKAINDIDSMFTDESFRLINLMEPFNEDIKKSDFIKEPIYVTVEFVIDKRHLWHGSGSADANSSNRLVNEGAEYYKKGKYEKAIELFDAAIRYYSNNPEAFYNRGVVKLKQLDNAGACDDFKRAFLLGDSDAMNAMAKTCK